MAWRWAALVALAAATLSGAAPPPARPPAQTAAPARTAAPSPTAPARLRVQVLESYPHDPTAFTQGLELSGGVLYEGTGLYGQSELRTVERRTGEVLTRIALPPTAFGEGITVVDQRIWQLTFQEQFAFLRERATLGEVRQVRYTGEGWGLCHDAARRRLVMTSGAAELSFRDPHSFTPLGSVPVTRDGAPLARINELECVGDRVWANIWLTDEIVRIDPATGTVDAVVDASGLLSPEEQVGADVLNGIAAVPYTDTFLITGKLWPRMFLVRFVPAS